MHCDRQKGAIKRTRRGLPVKIWCGVFGVFSPSDLKYGFVSRFPVAKVTVGILMMEKETLALHGGAGARI